MYGNIDICEYAHAHTSLLPQGVPVIPLLLGLYYGPRALTNDVCLQTNPQICPYPNSHMSLISQACSSTPHVCVVSHGPYYQQTKPCRVLEQGRGWLTSQSQSRRSRFLACCVLQQRPRHLRAGQQVEVGTLPTATVCRVLHLNFS